MDIIANASIVRIKPTAISPIIIPQINREANASLISLTFNQPLIPVNVIKNPVAITQTIAPSILTIPANVVIFMRRDFSVDRRTQRTAWQGRLGAKMDVIKTKTLDNSLLLTAHPTDMIRIRTERDNRTHDVNSRTIIAAEVLPIILPVMKDIPMRRMMKDGDKTVITFSMMEEQRPFEIYSALSNQLYRDDLLFRIIKDPYSDNPYLLVLQIKDELATMAYASLLYVKYKATIFDEPLPATVIDQIVSFAKKREELGW